MKTTWHRILGNALAVFGLAFAVAGIYGVSTTEAVGGPGTIKVHTESDCSGSDHDPKVGDQFWVGGTGFEAGTVRYMAVTDGTNASDPVVIGPVSVGSGSSFCSGPYTLTEGHYKTYVGPSSDAVTNNEKTKVFKVVPITDTSDSTETTEAPDTTDVTETTETPETTDVTETTETPSTDIPNTDDTTTSVESEGPTTTKVDSGGELPSTGRGAAILLTLGVTMVAMGVTMRMVARRVC